MSTSRPTHRRQHPTRHLLYAFVVGATITAMGFLLARFDHAGRVATPRQTLAIAGSEALRPLLAACANALRTRRRGRRRRCRGGGTAAGIAALLAGQVDLAMASRELTPAEQRAPGASAGVETAPQSIPIAIEAIAVITHPAVAVGALGPGQLRGLFDGSTRDWKELQAGEGTVTVVAHTAGSSTLGILEEQILAGRPLASAARRLATPEAIIEAVAATPGAIGHVDAHLAAGDQRVRTLALRRNDMGPAWQPVPDAIARGDYPFARSLSLVSLGPPRGPALAVIDHCRGAAGRARIEAAGLVPAPAS